MTFGGGRGTPAGRGAGAVAITHETAVPALRLVVNLDACPSVCARESWGVCPMPSVLGVVDDATDRIKRQFFRELPRQSSLGEGTVVEDVLG